MGKVRDTVTTINQTIRTFIMLCVVGALGSLGYVTYDRFDAEHRKLVEAEGKLQSVQADLQDAKQDIATKAAEIQRQAEEIIRVQTAMRLLKVDHRLARLEVLDQQTGENESVSTTVRFTELTPDGDTLGSPRVFTVPGDIVYVDNWIVKFEDKYVESADLVRGTSLTLFRRIFGEDQAPRDGFALDEVGSTPQAYLRGGQASDFEQEIWSQFWEFANDPDKAASKGIRAAHHQAVGQKVVPGKSYLIELRASDGLTIRPLSASEEKPKASI